MIARRTLLAATPGLILARPVRAQLSAAEAAVKGSAAYSESAMVMSVAADGSSALTLRFCRFPEAGFTWLWCHILKDGELYAFTRHDLGCSTARLADGAAADYRAPRAKARLSRRGRGAELSAVRFNADLMFHKSRAAPHGPGQVHAGFAGEFQPMRALAAEVREGRDEVYGTLRAQVRIGRQRFVHQGPAKFHEQRQEAPRFEGPFSYGWFSGPEATATTLLVARGASGGWIWDGAEQPLADMAIDPPGARREVAWRLKSGRTLPGRLEALARYEIPIFERRWQGSFVRGEVGGRPIVGVANDWTTPPDIYAAARERG